ncbi:hypothetical protein NLU13_7322 [Sarocladium strictum]|uniref:triacylglycerol lipase n=1 Tax=Sarocladium strictum TaxID=5046 RepID=A0AA39L5P9_SARSR|nr:hypothetical protein NLU13_7322 [Sarocladium strictum]
MGPKRRGSSRPCASTRRVTAGVLLSFLALSSTTGAHGTNQRFQEDIVFQPGPLLPSDPHPPKPAQHAFSLRHIYHHGTYKHPSLHRKRDIRNAETRVFLAAEGDHDEQTVPLLTAKSRPEEIERLRDRRPSVVDPMVAESRRQGFSAFLDASAWTTDEVPVPDITDKNTVLSMAYMAADAYVENEDGADWEDVGEGFDRREDFGWESDGLRGHIWADENNSTVVIGLKGTSPAVFDGEGTTSNDKLNDNLFFSCCCAQQGQWTYHQVCDCATGTYSCNNTCVKEALNDEHRYYTAAKELYANVTEIYPHSSIWLSGHSLGGAVSSLLAMTYGLPAVTFEAVPEALAASRLGLPTPPGSDPNAPQTRDKTGTYHFGHTADPVYIGSCNGATASCSYGGYALETACHAGRECVYDVVADKGWRVGIGTHKIRAVIKDVILEYDEVPECRFTPECRDCAQWKMYESNSTETTTTSAGSTSTRTRTRTTTCETPGWWGCLDKTATTTGQTSMPTPSTSTTSTCETPGWFGCKDRTTSEETTTTTSSSTTSSTTCETPGRFWGCRDEATPTTRESNASPVPITSAPTATATSPHPSQDRAPGKCLRRNLFGICKEWEHEDEDEGEMGEM